MSICKFYKNIAGQYGIYRPSSRAIYHHIKTIREDFNDMFSCECEYRSKVGDESLVFCLTYNDEHLRTFCGQNVADSEDLKRYSKSSVFGKRLKRLYGLEMDMLSVAEYGEGGITHQYVGKRGKGQNPHYHCAGFFHRVCDPATKDHILREWSKILGYVPNNVPSYEDLLVYTWQGCFERDPIKYGRNKKLRSLGLGHVEVSGSVINPLAGGSYYSKYIGKDIQDSAYEAYKSTFMTKWHFVALDVIGSENISPDHIQIVYDYWLNIQSQWHWSQLPKRDMLSIDMRKINSSICKHLTFDELGILDRICNILFDRYIDFYNEFIMPFKTRYSPKLRKFHGFGYYLLQKNECDQLKGTYYFTRKNAIIERNLPSSLYRVLYYSYVKLIPKNSLCKQKYVVKYYLNDTGKQHLKYSLDVRRAKVLEICDRFKSKDIRFVQYKDIIANYITIFYSRSFCNLTPKVFLNLLKDYKLSKQFCINTLADKSTICNCPCDCKLFDTLLMLKNNLPIVYKLVKSVIKYIDDLSVYRDTCDKLYLDAWLKCYKFSL